MMQSALLRHSSVDSAVTTAHHEACIRYGVVVILNLSWGAHCKRLKKVVKVSKQLSSRLKGLYSVNRMHIGIDEEDIKP
jgi:hypothetical protein